MLQAETLDRSMMTSLFNHNLDIVMPKCLEIFKHTLHLSPLLAV